MEGLGYSAVFTIPVSVPYFPNGIPISETVVVSWVSMLVIIVFAIVVTRRLEERPHGIQHFVELGVDMLNKFSVTQFGKYSTFLGGYMGTLFLFLLVVNIIPCLTPVEFSFMGRTFKPPFEIKPPSRDLSLTAPLAVLSVGFTLFFGIVAKKPGGWLKSLFQPVPFMLPFNIIEYGTRMLSLSLRLFGNMLGGFVIMKLLTGLIPIGIPPIASLYFDFFDGLMQAGIFAFLSCTYISEACKSE